MDFGTYFQLLPKEINFEILNKLAYSETIKLGKIPGLDYLFSDWSYWRQRSVSEFKIPIWYFDLPIEQRREISASQRYLEISSKFCLTVDSVVENGEGVINKANVLFLAQEQGNVELIEALQGDPRRLSNARFNAKLRSYGMMGPYFYHLERHQTEKMIATIDKVLGMIEQKNFRSLVEEDTEIIENKDMVATALVISDNQETFELLDKIFGFFDNSTKIIILIFCITMRKNKKFKHLISMSTLGVDDALLLYRAAYYSANRELITFFEEKEININASGKLYCLADGYLSNPRPVEVYQILMLIGVFNTEYYTLKSFKFDTDISILQAEGDLDRMKKYISGNEYTIGALRHFLTILKKEDKISFQNLYLGEEDPIKIKIFEEIRNSH